MAIKTTPPFPGSNHEWTAIDDEAYCGCRDCRCPMGRGRTEQGAIADLRWQMDEAECAS